MNNIAAKLVEAMGLDSGVTYTPTGCQMVDLEQGVGEMTDGGLVWNQEAIDMMAAGERDERFAMYGRYKGYNLVNGTLEDIFVEHDSGEG